MEFEEKVWKEGKFWLVEVPSLNLMTQGKSRKDALNMIEDATLGFIECYFDSEKKKDFDITVIDYNKTSFVLTSKDNNFFWLSLRKQKKKLDK